MLIVSVAWEFYVGGSAAAASVAEFCEVQQDSFMG